MRTRRRSTGLVTGVLALVLVAVGSACAAAEARVDSTGGVTTSLGEAPLPADDNVGTPDTDLGEAPAPDGQNVGTPDTELGQVPTPEDGSVGTPDDGPVDLGAPPVPPFDPADIDPADFPGQGVGDAAPDYFVYPDTDD